MVPQLKIYVEGSGSAFRTAERGVLHLAISSTSISQSEAAANVKDKTEALTKAFRRHALKSPDGSPHPSAGITTFSASVVRSFASYPLQRMGYPDASQLEHYTASVTYEVLFRDLELLAETANELSAMPYVSITRTEWQLTTATRVEVEREARKKAMENAVQKAEDYAGVVGRNVTAVEINDVSTSYSAMGTYHQYPYSNSRTVQDQRVAQQQVQALAPMSNPTQTQTDGPSVEPSTITATSQVNVRFISADREPMEDYDR